MRRYQSVRGHTSSIFPLILLIATLGDLSAREQEPAIQQPPAAAFTPSGVLSGRITNEAGDPLSGTRVELWRNVNGAAVQSARTGADGVYSFESVHEAGQHRIRVHAPSGYVGVTDYDVQPIVSLDEDSRLVKHFTLRTGIRVDVLVVDESGEPVSGASVFMNRTDDRRHREVGRSGTTDFAGRALFTSIPPSDAPHLITVTHPDFASGKENLRFAGRSEIPEVQVTLTKGFEVRGRAICSDGLPAAGWSVFFRPSWWTSGRLGETSEVDKQGYFTISHVPEGAGSFHISIPTGQGMSTSFSVAQARIPLTGDLLELHIPRESPGAMVTITGRIIRYEGRGHVQVDVVSQAGGAVFGDVATNDEFRIGPLPRGTYDLRFQSTEYEEKIVRGVRAPSSGLKVELEYTGKPHLIGRVVAAATGEAIRNFRLRAQKVSTLRGPHYVQRDQWQTTDDPDGKFDAEVVGPGIYRVQIAADGYAWTWTDEFNTDEISAGSSKESSNEPSDDPIEIALTPGGSIHGRVVDESGRPVDGAKVIPLSKARGTMPRVLNRFASENGAVATNEGRFTLEHLSPGDESLKVTHPDYCFTILEGLRVAEGDVTEDVEIVLTRGGTVQGRVFDSQGNPQPDVTLYFRDQFGYGGGMDEAVGRLATVVTDAEGRYRAERLPDQFCYVSRMNSWDTLGVVAAAIQAANGLTRTLDLGGTNRVSGQMIGADGTPIGETKVQIGGESPHFGVFKAFATTDGAGRFEFRGIPPGLYTFHSLIPGTQNGWAKVRAVRIPEHDLDLGRLTPPHGRIVVRLSADEGEEAARGWYLSLADYAPDRLLGGERVGNVDAAGRPSDPFIITNVPPGEYLLVAYRQDSPQIRKVVTLEEGVDELEIEMIIPESTSSLKVNVKGEAGTAIIFLWNSDETLLTPLDLRGGSSEVKRLPAANYLIGRLFSAQKNEVLTEFNLAENEAKTIEVDLSDLAPNSLGALIIRVLSDQGRPLFGAAVHLEQEGDVIQRIRPNDQDHHFRLPSGDYRLKVSLSGWRDETREISFAPKETGDSPASREIVIVELAKSD